MGMPMGGMPGGMPGMMGPSRVCFDPEMGSLLDKDRELDDQARELSMKYQRGSDADKEKVKAELEETVTKQFDVRQERRKLELKRLETQLEKLREAVDKREAAKKTLIDKRVSELLGTSDEIEF